MFRLVSPIQGDVVFVGIDSLGVAQGWIVGGLSGRPHGWPGWVVVTIRQGEWSARQKTDLAAQSLVCCKAVRDRWHTRPATALGVTHASGVNRHRHPSGPSLVFRFRYGRALAQDSLAAGGASSAIALTPPPDASGVRRQNRVGGHAKNPVILIGILSPNTLWRAKTRAFSRGIR